LGQEDHARVAIKVFSLDTRRVGRLGWIDAPRGSNGSGESGSMDLRPGEKDSVGKFASGRVPKIGDLQLYVCVVGYMPVDDNGKVVSKPESNFQSKPKPQ
jgi:hypothetical protein